MLRLVWFAALIAAGGLANGCSDDCNSDSDCPDGSYCQVGLCLQPDPGAGGSGGGGQTDPCTDRDDDAVCDADDNCPEFANRDQLDGDADRAGDACDPCPADPDNDLDGDGVCGDVDTCPDLANPSQIDTDGDGRGNACDADDDNDGVVDVEDCSPLDPEVYPGAFDACDGIDRDCVDACQWPVTTLGASQRIIDVSCLPDTRRCVVITTTAAGTGSLLLVDLDDTPSLLIATELSAPRGVAATWVDGEPIAWVTSPTAVRGIRLGGTASTFATLATGSGVLSGAVATIADDGLAVAAMEGSRLLIFDPHSVLGAGVSLDCSLGNTKCDVISFGDLADDAGPLGVQLPSGLALREKIVNEAPMAYLTFADDRRMAVLTIASPLLYLPASSGLLAPGLSEASLVHYDRDFNSVFMLDRSGSGARIVTHSSVALHNSDAFLAPAGSCPTTLNLFDSRLAVGDDCGDGNPGLLFLELDESGLPISSQSVRLPGCTPRRIAAVPAGEELGPPLLAVACEEADSLLVVGRN